ncbi:hypothetical protein K5X82_09480 [Halosquirtibacter xylanolyticus]|uniref:hypothetical protein n=1 Tax=Halosquirtibacter xylanolyticus TaxID=3374599 RepID=UPI003748D525|nr:hypothetical protein K5X82_09480 [Prolixibacteraceae bacterium]
MNRIIIFFCITISMWGCNSTPSATQGPNKRKNSDVGSVYYDVIIQSNKPKDDWEQIAIEKLDRDKLVQQLFKQIIDNKLRIEDFYEETKIPVAEFKKKISNGEIDPNKITKLQFEEVWNTQQVPIQKRIKSIVFAENAYDHLGKKMGYKPLFICYY